jgi:O-antigen/teichoic acid export membrane protein
LLFILCYRYVPLTWKPKITTAEIKPLLRYGGWITLTGVVGPLLTVFDRFLIGAKIGMIAVTAYTVPYNLVMYFSVIPGSMSTALFPRFAMMDAQQAQLLLSRSVKIITALISPIVVIGLLLIKPFLFFWINNSLAKEAAPIGQVLLLGIWINALALIPYTYLQGRGRPDIPAKFHALELVPFVAVLWLLIDYFGLEGAAWAWDIRVIADTILLFWAAGGIAQIQYALIAGIPVLLAFTISITLDYASVTYIWATLATFSISVGWSLVSLPEDLRTMLIRRLRNIQII